MRHRGRTARARRSVEGIAYAGSFQRRKREMSLYCCDRCHRVLDPEKDLCYVMQIDIAAALAPLIEECREKGDYLIEVRKILNVIAEEEAELVNDDVFLQMEFHLCHDCRMELASNPLRINALGGAQFSEN
jgi:hypothetical protein